MNDYELSQGAVGSVVEFKAATELRVLYENLFNKRYGSLPFIEDSDIATFSFLAGKFKGPKGHELIEAYFKLQDRFVVEKCYPVSLIRKSINQLLPLIEKKTTHTPNSLRMKITLSCDDCHRDFDWYGTHKELSNARRCDACRGMKRADNARWAMARPLHETAPLSPVKLMPSDPREEPRTVDSLPSMWDAPNGSSPHS